MNPQSLPEELLQLRDIHLPEPAGWWPPAIGWWLLTMVVLVIAGLLMRTLFKEYRFRRWRRRLMKAFLHDTSGLMKRPDSDFMTEISSRLKRLAISLFSNEQVAGLSGKAWLDFLDSHLPSPAFNKTPACLLVELPYHETGQPLDEQQRRQVLRLAENWARHNLSREHFHGA
jgi:hypothetical protein